MEHPKTTQHLQGCTDCQKKIPFEMPKAIVDACKEGYLVVFAGAGITTEGKGVFPYSFYDEIRADLKCVDEPSFPILMSRFVESTHDRRALLNKIKTRIDYAKSFPELYRRATNFHQELSTIFQIQEIITTNWDDFFERECAATPLVSDGDFAYWDQPFRKVFKIHGSITNPGSIVATDEDYRECYRRLGKGLVGANLRQLLATKTIVFLGYSFGDYDFNRIYQYLHRNMGDILPHAYFVTLQDQLDSKILPGFSPTIIKTDATFFIEILKQKLIDEKQLLPDEIYHLVFLDFMKAREIHNKTVEQDARDNPSVIYCASYQDGVIHALERGLGNRSSGKYSHSCDREAAIRGYFRLRKSFLQKKKYFDVAYIDGYIAGLFCFIPELRKECGLPLYYVFGVGPIASKKDYLRASKDAAHIHKGATDSAKAIAKRAERGIVFSHTPFLLGASLEEA